MVIGWLVVLVLEVVVCWLVGLLVVVEVKYMEFPHIPQPA